MNAVRTILISLLYCLGASAQYISVDENYTTFQLVNDVLIDNPCASASNIAITGWSFGSGNTFGYFSANGSGFPLQDGIVLTTGRAASAVGPNDSLLSEGPANWSGDADLEAALQVSNSINATVLEFDFLPNASRFSFDYIFSSEQYLSNPSANQCNYTDGLVFLLKKANTSDPYVNLALIPDTNLPVRVNTIRGPGTICPSSFPEYFDAFNGNEHPTNYNGQTKVMTAKGVVEPNVLYHIKIVIADQGNNLYDSALFLGGGSFKVQKDLGPDRLVSQFNGLCPGETLLLDATESGALSYQWYESGVPIAGATNPTYLVNTAGSYSVAIALTPSCNATGEIRLEYETAPLIDDDVTLVQCDSDGDNVSIFNLGWAIPLIANGDPTVTGATFYHNLPDAISTTNIILDSQAFSNATENQVIARIAYSNFCAVYATVRLALSTAAVQDVEVAACDDDAVPDGKRSFDLASEVAPSVQAQLPANLDLTYYASENDALLQTNPLPNNFAMTQAFSQLIYARSSNGFDCYSIIPVTLAVSVPDLSGFHDENISLCNGGQATLGLQGIYDSYLWTTGETTPQITISSPGLYTVTVSSGNGCLRTKTFIVAEPDPPVFVSAETQDFAGGSNSITIIYQGNSDYEFSIDGSFFQSSPYFGNLAAGLYHVYIRDTAGCSLIGPFDVLIIDYPRYFTPNGDGFHDRWEIPFLSSRPGSSVSIFDRFGKFIYSFAAGEQGWDGKMNSRELPSSDYWFLLDLAGSPPVKGHFSLKR